jgi:hypothetical protein
MTRDQVKAVLDRVLTWPPERQEDAVRVLEDMEELDASDCRLSGEQVAEIERRMAEPNPDVMTLEELNAHFQRRFGE